MMNGDFLGPEIRLAIRVSVAREVVQDNHFTGIFEGP